MRISDWSSDVCSSDLAQDFIAKGVNPGRTDPPARTPRSPVAGLAPAPNPVDRRRYANLKPSGSSPTGHPAIDCLDHSLTKIRRKSPCHEGWPPSPALTVNHKSMPKNGRAHV